MPAAADTDPSYEINVESASVLAALFLTDNVEYNPLTAWTDQTTIFKAVEMTDTDGNPSAYSFELDADGEYAGYIVISAHYDIGN